MAGCLRAGAVAVALVALVAAARAGCTVTALGCFKDVLGKPVMQHQINPAPDQLTLEVCAQACSQAGFSVGGAEG